MDIQDKALKITADLWNNYLDIPLNEKHPDDTNDFRFHLHALQNILYAQKYKKNEKGLTVEITGAELIGVLNHATHRNNAK